MIDIFQYTNLYTTTPLINHLITNPKMQKECVSFITKSGINKEKKRGLFVRFFATKY